MKLTKCILMIAVIAAPSAFAARSADTERSNWTCANSSKSDTIGRNLSLEPVQTVFGAAPKRQQEAHEQGSPSAVREGKTGG